MSKWLIRGLFLIVLIGYGADALFVMSARAPSDRRRPVSSAYLARVKRGNELLQKVDYAWHHDHDLATAKATLNGMLAENLSRPEVLLTLAKIADEEGNHKEALHYYDKLLGFHKYWRSGLQDDPLVVGRYAELCEEQGRSKQAMAAFSKMLALASQQQRVHWEDQYGPTWSLTRDPIEIRMRAHILMALLDQHHRRRAGTGYSADLEQRLAGYRAAVRLKPKSALAHYYLGYGLRRQRRTTEAQVEFAIAENLGGEEFRRAIHRREDELKALKAQQERQMQIAQQENPTLNRNQSDPNRLFREWGAPALSDPGIPEFSN